MAKQVPLTLQLISKYAFVRPEKKKQVEKEEEASVAEDQSERTESTDVTKAQSEVPKFDAPADEEAKSDSEESDSGLEDNEATILEQKQNIEQALRESQSNFLAKVAENEGKGVNGGRPIVPTINRRLGGGLAALVKQKVLARHQSKIALEAKTKGINEDSSDKEEDEMSNKPRAGNRAGSLKKEEQKEENKKEGPNVDDASDDDEDEDGSLEDVEVGKGYDEDSDIDLTEITEQDVQEQKLKVLHEKLEEDYQKGFDPTKDA